MLGAQEVANNSRENEAERAMRCAVMTVKAHHSLMRSSKQKSTGTVSGKEADSNDPFSTKSVVSAKSPHPKSPGGNPLLEKERGTSSLLDPATVSVYRYKLPVSKKEQSQGAVLLEKRRRTTGPNKTAGDLGLIEALNSGSKSKKLSARRTVIGIGKKPISKPASITGRVRSADLDGDNSMLDEMGEVEKARDARALASLRLHHCTFPLYFPCRCT
jgi:hypothetical protein